MNDVKHWLNRAFYADKKVKALDLLTKQYRERAEGLNGKPKGDRGKSDTATNSTEASLLRLAEMTQKLETQKAELMQISDEIQSAISQLHDNDLETVLIHRYLLFHTIEQTAEFMNYSTETVRRKTNKAIAKMCENVLECGN